MRCKRHGHARKTDNAISDKTRENQDARGKRFKGFDARQDTKMAQIQFRFLGISSFIAAVLLSGCAGLMSHTVEVPLEKLQASLAKQFPFNSDFARLMDLTISSPKLRTLPEENRIATEVEVSLAPRFTSGKISGTLWMDSALRFEPSDSTVRLVKPRLTKLDVAGAKDINLKKIAEFIVESAMNDAVIYQVKEADLKRYGTNWVPSDFKVTRAGISVTLAPQK
jgi:hypothetical protein